MNDIVGRLRGCDDLSDQALGFLCVEAADEIERLHLEWTGMKSEVELCHAEIGRLVTEDQRKFRRIIQGQAEIERLRVLLKRGPTLI